MRVKTAMTPRARLMLFSALLWSWIAGALFRLYDLQVVRHEHYAQRADRQQQRVVVLDPPRGTIYDARGRELAVSLEVESVAVDPSRVADPDAVLVALSEALSLGAAEREALSDALGSDREFAWVERKVDPAVAAAIRAHDLDGVILLPESKRYYPLGSLAAQVLGYVGTDREGLAGLEFLYDDVVAGEVGRRIVYRDARLGTVLYPRLEKREARPGEDLHLTLDAALQHVVERELAAAVAEKNATRGTVVMLDPATGDVLAMASWPTFDPNRFGEFPPASWRNQAVADAYEPGSTFKMVTLAAALGERTIRLDDTLDCQMGSVVLHATRINDHKPFGILSAREVLAKSSNVGAIKLGLGAGPEALYRATRAFGFGEVTGVDLPSESAGLLRPLERWSELTPAYVSFGQGLSVTALQLANAFAAVANGGELLRPRVVAATGAAPPRPREVLRRAAPPDVVAGLRDALSAVVANGTARAAAVPGFPAAGKTGTAQKAAPGGYAVDRYIASFAGFAPYDDPAVVIAVVLDEPWPDYHGGSAAAPVFRRIAEQTLLYLGRRPRRDLPQRWPGEAPAAPEPPRPMLAALPIAAPDATSEATEPRVLAAATRDGVAATVPDFAGLSARQAVRLAAGLGLELRLAGHGRVLRQLPAAGTPFEVAGDRLELWLGTETR